MKFAKIVLCLFLCGFVIAICQPAQALQDGGPVQAQESPVVPMTAVEQQAPAPKPPAKPVPPAVDVQALQQKIIELNTEIEMLRYAIGGIQADIRKNVYPIAPFTQWYDRMDGYEQQLNLKINERTKLVQQLQQKQ